MPTVKEYFEDESTVSDGIDVEYRETKGRLRKSKSKSVRRNIDYSQKQYEELQVVAEAIGITSQAAVKVAIQQFIDNYYAAQSLKNKSKKQKGSSAG